MAVEAYLDGTATLAATRLALLRRSVLYFAQDLPAPFEVHHGTVDTAVEVVHSQLLAHRMNELGIPAPAFVLYEYPGGRHGQNMPESQERQQAFLCELID
jgi:dipeptidyl aminopeptidase/acylaminoacyl peptidase